jgi:hypothetical protein
MRDFIKKALTRRIPVKGRRKQIELEPSSKLVYGMYFAIASLISLTILEAVHIVVLHTFSSEIFAAITLVIGTILGAFFGQKA